MYPKLCKQYDDGTYGWWIVVPSDFGENLEDSEIPHDLQVALMLVKAHDCDWIMLDRDAEYAPELTVFNW